MDVFKEGDLVILGFSEISSLKKYNYYIGKIYHIYDTNSIVDYYVEVFDKKEKKHKCIFVNRYNITKYVPILKIFLKEKKGKGI